jgi:hypothetical protein
MPLDGQNRIAVAGDYQDIDALAVDRAVGARVGGGQNLTEADLRHHTPVEVRRAFFNCPFGGVQNVSLRP